MVRRETRQRRLDDMSFLMLAGVLVNQTIRTARRHGSSENPLPLLTGPFTRFFTDAERLDCTGGDGRADGLGHFVFALAATAVAGTASAAGWGGGFRVGSVVTATGATCTGGVSRFCARSRSVNISSQHDT